MSYGFTGRSGIKQIAPMNAPKTAHGSHDIGFCDVEAARQHAAERRLVLGRKIADCSDVIQENVEVDRLQGAPAADHRVSLYHRLLDRLAGKTFNQKVGGDDV